MKQRLIALGLVGSPLALAVACTVLVALSCSAGWLFFGTENQSRLIRIVQLAPLVTPQAGGVAEAIIAPDESSGFLAPQPGVASSQPLAPENGQSFSQEEINQARGFSLPEGSVNAITQEGVATRLVVPKLGLDAPVALSPIENQTWKVDHLGTTTVGHLEGTARPGANSNIVLAAHVTVDVGVYGPFAHLSDLLPGDSVYVYYGTEQFEYVIDDYQLVDRSAIQVTHPSNTARLTLITCSNWSSEEGRYLERLVVGGYLKS